MNKTVSIPAPNTKGQKEYKTIMSIKEAAAVALKPFENSVQIL